MVENPKRYQIKPSLEEKTDAKLPDYLLCLGRVFCIMFEHSNLVFGFILRLSKEKSSLWGEYALVQKAAFPEGDDWYNITIDCTKAKQKRSLSNVR